MSRVTGPFGLSMGMKSSEFDGKLEKIGSPGLYQITEVPKSHSAFDTYFMLFGPESGLCRIIASGKTIETSVYGTELRNVFDSLEERLHTQYGKNKRYDFLLEGSIWDQPRDFMAGLLKKERKLITYWIAEDGSPLRDNLEAITLEAVAISDEQGFINVAYQFENFEQCQKELEAAEDDAL